MSVLATTVTATTIGNADVGTATTGDNTTKIASGAFLLNTFTDLNYVIKNAASYVITGVKTFTNGFPLTSGTNALFPITIGAIKASIIDILPASSATQYVIIMGQSQLLGSNFGPTTGTNVFRNPIVVKDSNNRMLNGTVSATTTGTQVNFSTPFATVPLVFVGVQNNPNPGNTGVFDVTVNGFKAYASSTYASYWFAIGS